MSKTADLVVEVTAALMDPDPWAHKPALEKALAEITRLDRLINTPHTDEWLEAVRLEAAHQIDRWGVENDRGKSPPDWFWLIGYLAGKALASALKGDGDKAQHHTISTAAVLLNWWRRMRGIELTYQPACDDVAQLVDA